MHSCLDENVKFSDFAFKIQGKEVKAIILGMSKISLKSMINLVWRVQNLME